MRLLMLVMRTLLDNSAVNHLAPASGAESPAELFIALDAATREGKVEVWITPTNVIELSLYKDYDHRSRLARNLNVLANGIRFLPDFEFQTLREFLSVLATHMPAAIRHRDAISQIEKRGIMPFIALLAQMACIPDYKAGYPEEFVRAKLGTYLAQLIVFSDPENYIPEFVKQARGEEVDKQLSSRLAEIDDYSIEELEAEITKAKKQVVRFRNLTTWQRNRNSNIHKYASAVAAEAVMKCFDWPQDLYYLLDIFDFKVIADNWEVKMPKEHYYPLPSNIREPLLSDSIPPSIGVYPAILQMLAWRYSTGLLPSTWYSVSGFFMEIEKNFRSPEKISRGLALDLNYIGVLPSFDLFITFDSFQANAAEKYAASLKEEKDGVISNKQLTVLRKPTEVYELLAKS